MLIQAVPLVGHKALQTYRAYRVILNFNSQFGAVKNSSADMLKTKMSPGLQKMGIFTVFVQL